ncbi:hypothetical protein NUACC26_061870 [Scytonema sp. NUACC26]
MGQHIKQSEERLTKLEAKQEELLEGIYKGAPLM